MDIRVAEAWRREGNGVTLSIEGPGWGEIPPPDEAAHLDSELMAELSNLNYLLSRYVLRHYDADAGRTTPTSVAEELALADCLTAATEAVRARAERRESGDGPR